MAWAIGCAGVAAGRRRRRVALLLAVAVLGVGAAPGVGAPGPGAARAAWAAPPGFRCSTPSNDLVPGVPWTLQRLAAPRVWELSRGKGVLVGVIDTGVDRFVPQLAGRVLPGFDVVNGRGTADNDCFGHGTFVAGIIAAQPAPGTGVVGLAPGVTILPVRQANNSTDGTASGLARSIRSAVDGGARVVNISASAFYPNEELRAAVQYASARDVVLVASASNEAQSGNPTPYPAAYPEVIAVGAVGKDGRRTGFSEVGDYLDMVGPGSEIISLSRGGRGHLVDSGTSYATPFVTATAALVRSYHPTLTAAQVKRRLEVTADHPAAPMPDPQMGWGIVNPYNAVAGVVPDEHGARPRLGAPPPLKPVKVAGADTSARDTALAFVLGAGILLVLAAVLAYVGPRGARRGWRPADEPGTGAPIGGAR